MSSPSQNTLKIGIVGFGRFAQFLAKTMIKQGHRITATSRSDYSNLGTQMGISFFGNMNEFLEAENDVILFCTSILSLSQVISKIPFDFLKKPALFVDVLSVKEHPRDLMLQVLPQESDVLCTHPMFGPDSGKYGWKGLTFMYDKVRIRNEDICSSYLQIFSSEGCKMMEMTCEEHDRLAADTQFVTHFFGRTLGELGIARTPIDTQGYQKLYEVKESTMRDSFDLFNGLFMYNRYAREQLRKIELAFETIKQQLLKGTDEKQEPSIQT